MSTTYLFLFFLSLLSGSFAVNPTFRDVTVKAGIDLKPGHLGRRKLLKYGGPTIADLDRDGRYDLIFVHHGSSKFEVYFNDGDGTFTKSPTGVRRDIHAITPFLIPHSSDCFFTLVPGGNRGGRANPPVVYRVLRNRTIIDVSESMGLDQYTGRGRTVIFVPLRTDSSYPDALYLNADASPKECPGCTDGQFDAYAYRSRGPPYRPRLLRGFNPSVQNHHSLAIDTDGDGQMEIMTWRNLQVHKIVSGFRARDVSRSVLGEFAYLDGVAAVAEIDYDNDGDLDLYIARDVFGFRNSTRRIYADVLLENRGGSYVNVAVEAGVPQDTVSRGVTVGDFNNDGLMDVYVSVFQLSEDVLLINNGDKTFRRIDIGIGKQGAFGDNAMAVDYDGDGRVDLVRSEGDWGLLSRGGQFRILRNVRDKQKIGGWVKVRVGWQGVQTSQHAVVEVVADGRRSVQRVGQAGVQTPHSYFDILHFGIGKAARAEVKVTWLNGVKRTKTVQKGKTVEFGTQRTGLARLTRAGALGELLKPGEKQELQLG